MKGFRFVIFLLLCCGYIANAQDYTIYLEKSRQFLENCDFVAAQKSYDIYKELTGKTDKEIEQQIEECIAENNKMTSFNGFFSVSPNKKVYFSKGNLQYKATTKTWRFAGHQWDYIGWVNEHISPRYDGWIDLFGWGTSGYDNKMPYMTSKKSTSYRNKIVLDKSKYDWGVFNIISNGRGKNWRTLNIAEWSYVFTQRNTVSGIRYAMAKVNGVNGVILLPDNWSESYYNLIDTNKPDASYKGNQVSLTDWTNKLEAKGAVFLPAAGMREGTSVKYAGVGGYYWSHNYWDSEKPGEVIFFNTYLESYSMLSPCYIGQSVRLVSDAEE